MSGDELIESEGTADLVQAALASDEAARSYLRRAWLSAATLALKDARRRAGKTQADVARALSTTQSAIARLENDRAGRFTLRRFIDYVVACDAMALDIATDELGQVRAFVAANPAVRHDVTAYAAWCSTGGRFHQPKGSQRYRPSGTS